MYTVHTDSPDQHWPASADCDACVVLGDPLTSGSLFRPFNY